MSFCVVPASSDGVDAALLGQREVHAEQPHRGGVDRHRRVHLVERDARRTAPASRRGAGTGHADLADLAPRERVVGVVAGLRGQVEGHREAGLALGQVGPVELVRRARRRMARSTCASARVGPPRSPFSPIRDRGRSPRRQRLGVVVEADAGLPARGARRRPSAAAAAPARSSGRGTRRRARRGSRGWCRGRRGRAARAAPSGSCSRPSSPRRCRRATRRRRRRASPRC